MFLSSFFRHVRCSLQCVRKKSAMEWMNAKINVSDLPIEKTIFCGEWRRQECQSLEALCDWFLTKVFRNESQRFQFSLTLRMTNMFVVLSLDGLIFLNRRREYTQFSWSSRYVTDILHWTTIRSCVYSPCNIAMFGSNGGFNFSKYVTFSRGKLSWDSSFRDSIRHAERTVFFDEDSFGVYPDPARCPGRQGASRVTDRIQSNVVFSSTPSLFYLFPRCRERSLAENQWRPKDETEVCPTFMAQLADMSNLTSKWTWARWWRAPCSAT